MSLAVSVRTPWQVGGDDRAIGGDPLVGPELVLQLPNREGEAGIGLRLHAGLLPGTAAESDGGEAEQPHRDDREQNHQRNRDDQCETIWLRMMPSGVFSYSHGSMGLKAGRNRKRLLHFNPIGERKSSCQLSLQK